MAAHPRHPTLLDTPQIATLMPADSAELWRVLDRCARLDEGVVLSPTKLARLVDAAALRFGLERQQVYWAIVPYLAALVVEGRDRVLWDTQREPLLVTLTALAQS